MPSKAFSVLTYKVWTEYKLGSVFCFSICSLHCALSLSYWESGSLLQGMSWWHREVWSKQASWVGSFVDLDCLYLSLHSQSGSLDCLSFSLPFPNSFCRAADRHQWVNQWPGPLWDPVSWLSHICHESSLPWHWRSPCPAWTRGNGVAVCSLYLNLIR